MLKLVVIDLRAAKIQRFEEYEQQIVPLLAKHGGPFLRGVRSVDAATEIHLLFFPDTISFKRFLADPVRVALQDAWALTGAKAIVSDVRDVGYT